jgi:hypothetical protein
MSHGREWAMTLTVKCAVDGCPAVMEATVAGVSAHAATEGAKKVLRYLGWTISRMENRCAVHSGPIPSCVKCGEPTPRPYAIDPSRILRGLSCIPCHQEALREAVREEFGREMTR